MTEQLQEPISPNTEGRLAYGCLGALLIHPLLFAFAFVKGFTLGSGREMVMSATGGSGPTKYLIEGGLTAMGNLAIVYLMAGFIVIPLASLVGAFFGVLLRKRLGSKRRNSPKFSLKSGTAERIAFAQRFSWAFLAADVILSAYWITVVSLLVWIADSVLACFQASRVFPPKQSRLICSAIIGCLISQIGIEAFFLVSQEITLTPTISFLINADRMLQIARITAVIYVSIRVVRVLSEERQTNVSPPA